MMKKLYYCLLVVTVICIGSSCSNKGKKSENPVDVFRSELTAADTTAMLRLCDDAMELLKQKQVDQVLASLSEYNDSTGEVLPLSEEMSRRYARRFQMFPVLDYKRLYYSFMLEGCNDVKYEVTFATAEQTGSEADATTMFMFNPVKVNGAWSLCVKNTNHDLDEQNL